MTIWKPVPGHERYDVSRDGQVRNAANKSILAPRLTKGGYHRVALGKGNDRYIHHLVLEAFCGPRPCGHEASHRNGDKSDNRATNLAWETPKQNNARKNEHGTALVGMRNHMRRKTHCVRGHEFSSENTRHTNGRRVCRACAAEAVSRTREAMRVRLSPSQEIGVLECLGVSGGTPVTIIVRRCGFTLDAKSAKRNGALLRNALNQLEASGYVSRIDEYEPAAFVVTPRGVHRTRSLKQKI